MFIGGLKSPELATSCANLLRSKGLIVDVELNKLARDAYLQRLASARIALLLPYQTEGFYLPALEAMAADVCVVVPDCIGNRSFCLNGVNSIVPNYSLEHLTQAALNLAKRPDQQKELKHNARSMVINHTISNEYHRFLDVLVQLDKTSCYSF